MFHGARAGAVGLTLLLLLTACGGKSMGQLAETIAKAELENPSAIRNAIRDAAVSSGNSEKTIAQDWAKFHPTRPIGTAVKDATSDFIPELRENRTAQTPDVVARIDFAIQQSQAEQIMKSSICSLAVQTIKTGTFPSPHDIFVTVSINTLGKNIPAVKLQQTVAGISTIFADAQNGDVQKVRLDLIKRHYC